MSREPDSADPADQSHAEPVDDQSHAEPVDEQSHTDPDDKVRENLTTLF